jgi:hypothetical protein
MEFVVEFEINVPEGTSESDLKQRESAEAAGFGVLAREGHTALPAARRTGGEEGRRRVPRR